MKRVNWSQYRRAVVFVAAVFALLTRGALWLAGLLVPTTALDTPRALIITFGVFALVSLAGWYSAVMTGIWPPRDGVEP